MRCGPASRPCTSMPGRPRSAGTEVGRFPGRPCSRPSANATRRHRRRRRGGTGRRPDARSRRGGERLHGQQHGDGSRGAGPGGSHVLDCGGRVERAATAGVAGRCRVRPGSRCRPLDPEGGDRGRDSQRRSRRHCGVGLDQRSAPPAGDRARGGSAVSGSSSSTRSAGARRRWCGCDRPASCRCPSFTAPAVCRQCCAS